MNEIVFVCTGNTCRSPMAEALFRARGGPARTGLTPASAGLFAHEGLPASDYAVQAVGELGGVLSGHKARQLTPEIVAQARYLVCMTAAHYDRLLALYPQAEKKVFTLAACDMPDPFGGSLAVYRQSAADIDKAVEALIENLEQRP